MSGAATNTLTIDNVQESNKQTVAAVCHHSLSCKNGEVETFTIQSATAVESVYWGLLFSNASGKLVVSGELRVNLASKTQTWMFHELYPRNLMTT